MTVEAQPLIGLTSYVQRARWGTWDKEAVLVPASYVGAVEEAGGQPVILPSTGAPAPEAMDAIDGLVVIGGNDIDPGAYGAEPDSETTGTREERDRAELALLALALQQNLPVLGICRGMQLLNVVHGGDLIQHLPHQVGTDNHRIQRGAFHCHDVRLEPGSFLGDTLGAQANVPSHHHQAPGRIGKGLRATGWAEDGTVEGLEATGRHFAVGVLWHPEESTNRALLDCFVQEATVFRSRRESI
ncbi:MAG: gamma-glutamyl-gamma-aminobutyrate hydrolase family protein [Actinobacteria bacterium]|nr:gamma-glutamyl-gamma-aminobutyrate hydrolase family protein [Actinomycetota bacterium]